MRGSLEVPELPKSSASGSPSKPPLVPRSSPKLPQEKEKPPTSQSASDDLMKEMEDELNDFEERGDEKKMEEKLNVLEEEGEEPSKSLLVDPVASPEEIQFVVTPVVGLNDMQDGLSTAVESATSISQQKLHDLREMDQTLTNPASQSHRRQFDDDTPKLTGVPDDPLLKEMEEELNDVGWAEDDALLAELNLEVSNTVCSPVEHIDEHRNELVKPGSDCLQEPQPINLPSEASQLQSSPPVAKVGVRLAVASKLNVTDEDAMSDDFNNDAWAEDDPLLQEMEAELNEPSDKPIENEHLSLNNLQQENHLALNSYKEHVSAVPQPVQALEPSEGMISKSKETEKLNSEVDSPDTKVECQEIVFFHPITKTEHFSELEMELNRALAPPRESAADPTTSPSRRSPISSTLGLHKPLQNDVENEIPPPFDEGVVEAFGSSTSSFSFDLSLIEGRSQNRGLQNEPLVSNSLKQIQRGRVENTPPTTRNHDGLNDFFEGFESTAPLRHDSDDELPIRSRMLKSLSGDDLEKEMASLLAVGSEVPVSDWRPSVDELDTDGDSVVSAKKQHVDGGLPDDQSIPEQIQAVRQNELDNGTSEDPNYSSGHAHSDWLKLNELMKRNSLLSEYESCWGSLCTLSVVCADLPTEEFGLRSPDYGKKRKSVKNRSKRSWLPLELVQGLWNLVLSSEGLPDSTRVTYVCSKLHDVLVESQYLEILERRENESSLPHSTWVRVRKEKMVLLGFALPISIAKQSEWMRKLANAIVSDTDFWYGRFALPTIAIAGGDGEAQAMVLLRDMDFVQSRLDVVGIVTGTRRHVLDCRNYVQAKKKSFRDRQFQNDEFKVEIVDEAGHDVALDGCQQVATCLYRQGQVLTKSTASAVQRIELAEALRLIGTAVGEWGDWEMEMHIYQKNMKVLRECGGETTECAADTLLSMGHCSLGQGDLDTAMGCYEEAHGIYQNQLGETCDKVAQALHHMGVIYCERGEFESALQTLKTSLKIKQSNGMKNDYDEKTADTLCWIGKVYREKDFPDKAKKYFDTARDVKEEYFGADSLEVAEILHCIAVLYDDQRDFDRSLRYYRKSLKIRRAALGDQHEDVCDTITCIGNVYKSMGDDATALKVFRRANDLRSSVAKSSSLNKGQTKTLIQSYEDILDILRIQLRTSANPDVEKDEISSILLKMGHLYDTINNFSKCDRCFDKALELRMSSHDNVHAAQVLNVKGISFAKRQKYAEAMSVFEEALALRKKSLGDGHIDVAETLHNMGNCAAKSGDLNEARAYYDEALRIKRKQLGNNNTSVAQTLHNIGNVLVAQGSNEGAMKSYKEALTLRTNVLGHEHIEVAYSLHCIAKINRKQHDLEAARENFNASLRIKRLKLPKNHTSIAETLEQLGSLYLDLGQEDEGALCLNAALGIYRSKHGEGVKAAQVYEQLGGKYERDQNIAKALTYFNRSLRVRQRVLGDNHKSVADMQYRIGKLQRDQKSDHEALASFQAATKIRKKMFGRDDLVISDILTDAGILQMKLGQVDIADKCFSEALRIRNLALDPRHEKIGECLVLSGNVLVEKARYAEAIALFQEALSIFCDNSGEYGLKCADAYQNLGRAYKLTNDFDKAQENYGKCLKARKDHQGDEHLDVARITCGLGEVYFAKGDYRLAEEYFRDSVEVLVSHLGDNHLDVANAVLSLGRTCNKLNSPDEALMYFEQAQLIKHHHLGDYCLEVIEIDVEIGRSHAVKQEYDEALKCFQSYLRSRRATIGDDEMVCDILLEIGTAELDLGRYDAALKSLASALALYRVLLGDETVQVATTLYALGVVYEAKGAYPESMKYHKEGFRLRRRLLGPDDLVVAQSLDKVSQLYMKQPNLEKALQSIKEVLRIRTQKLGKDHSDVGTSLFGMGVIFSERNELDKAMECYRVSLEIRRQHLGDTSVEVAQTLHNLGTVLGKEQDFEAALDHWRRALVAYREAGLSDEDHLVAVTIGNINMAEAYLEDSKPT